VLTGRRLGDQLSPKGQNPNEGSPIDSH
jgi:hypothetical protein